MINLFGEEMGKYIIARAGKKKRSESERFRFGKGYFDACVHNVYNINLYIYIIKLFLIYLNNNISTLETV